MKKILITVISVFAFSMVAAQAIEVNKAAGVSFSMTTVDTNLKDDIDNNGTNTTDKNISNDVTIPSLFGEVSIGGDRGFISIGVDYIFMEAELDARSTTQSSLKSSSDGAASSGTNSGNVEVSDHTTFYIRPTIMLNDTTMIFGTFGSVSADAETKLVSISSTNKTISQTIDGDKIGFGIRKMRGSGFVQLELAEVDYDPITATTSNNTKITADIDTELITLSFGKSF